MLEIEGPDLQGLMNEAGGHRVQRVPPNDRRGRVHSSTVVVRCLDPDPLRGQALAHARRSPSDFELTWFSGSGAGGQHRNKHQNSARLRHLPTGLVVTAQCRKRPESEMQARVELARRLDALARGDADALQGAVRQAQGGLGERADKRRTYRFQEDRVTDHLTGRAIPCSRALAGHLDALWS